MDWAFVSQCVFIIFGWIRVGLFLLLFILNCTTLRVMYLFRCNRLRCHYRFLTGLVCLSNILYLCTWIPFIIYGITNGHSMIIKRESYCFLQYFITNTLGIALLSVAALRILDIVCTSVFSLKSFGPTSLFNILLIAWLLPMYILNVVRPARKTFDLVSNQSFYFINRITNLNLFCTERRKAFFGVGFLICKEDLNEERLQELQYEYICLIIPPALFCIVCVKIWIIYLLVIKKRRKAIIRSYLDETVFYDYLNRKTSCNRVCQLFLTTIDIVLAINVVWQVFIRPLMILHAVNHAKVNNSPMVFVDLGSHLIFTISSAFAPMIVKHSESVAEEKPFTLASKKKLMSFQQESYII